MSAPKTGETRPLACVQRCKTSLSWLSHESRILVLAVWVATSHCQPARLTQARSWPPGSIIGWRTLDHPMALKCTGCCLPTQNQHTAACVFTHYTAPHLQPVSSQTPISPHRTLHNYIYRQLLSPRPSVPPIACVCTFPPQPHPTVSPSPPPSPRTLATAAHSQSTKHSPAQSLNNDKRLRRNSQDSTGIRRERLLLLGHVGGVWSLRLQLLCNLPLEQPRWRIAHTTALPPASYKPDTGRRRRPRRAHRCREARVRARPPHMGPRK